MKAMQTRLYTNTILTVIAILLAVLAFQPVMDFASTAYAQRDVPLTGGELGRGDTTATSGDREQANAQKEIADAIRELATAMAESGSGMQDSAAAQREIADAIRGLGSGGI
jgi:hypothetical protein